VRQIAFIAGNEFSPWGGSEHLWSAAAEKLAGRGVKVCVSAKDWGAPVKHVERLRSVGCQIVHRRWPPSLAARLGRNLGILPEYIRDHTKKVGAGADLVVVSQGGASDGLQWMEALRSNGYRYTAIVPGAAEIWWPVDDQVDRLAEAYEGACAAYFVSEATLALCRRQFAAPLRHGRVVRQPFNVRYDARPAWPAGPSEELRLAYVARLEIGGKGHDVLIDTLGDARWRNRQVSVSFVGSGPNERAIRRMVSDLGLKNVYLSGFVEDIERVWSNHHALVFPSRLEGMPLALVEAMLCGRPGIATDVGGNRELIRDGVNGFLARAPTVELLDEAMNRAWENRYQLREMGKTAAIDVRKWVSSDPAEEFARQLEELGDGANDGN
jgi:glycosyltransferase involved in cell wall biosynthesis